MTFCEIWDQEILRTKLDQTSGYAIRYRYLNIPLSDAEQKEFFAAWGEKIHSAMQEKLVNITRFNERLLFLNESQLLIDEILLRAHLDRNLIDLNGGNHALQAQISLREHVNGLFSFGFNSFSQYSLEHRTGRSYTQFQEVCTHNNDYAFVIPDSLVDDSTSDCETHGDKLLRKHFGTGSATIKANVQHVDIKYSCEPFIMRMTPTCGLMQLHGAHLNFIATETLANSIKSIEVIINGYQILKISADEFSFKEPKNQDRFYCQSKLHLPEEHEKFLMLRPQNLYSSFYIDFFNSTPRRLFSLR